MNNFCAFPAVGICPGRGLCCAGKVHSLLKTLLNVKLKQANPLLTERVGLAELSWCLKQILNNGSSMWLLSQKDMCVVLGFFDMALCYLF